MVARVDPSVAALRPCHRRLPDLAHRSAAARHDHAMPTILVDLVTGLGGARKTARAGRPGPRPDHAAGRRAAADGRTAATIERPLHRHPRSRDPIGAPPEEETETCGTELRLNNARCIVEVKKRSEEAAGAENLGGSTH